MSDDFNGRYILDEAGHPMPCPDLMTWAMWYEKAISQCRIARDQVGDCTVSTIFLALDNSFEPGGVTNDPLHYQPVLWETMAFDVIGAPIFQRRYRSRELALEGHAEAIRWVERNLKLQESQLAEMLSEISESVVPDRGTCTDTPKEIRESPEGQAEPSEVDGRRIWGGSEGCDSQQDNSEHHEDQGKPKH